MCHVHHLGCPSHKPSTSLLLLVHPGRTPFQKIEKSSVLQEARKFNETPIKPQKCALILTKVLYLISQVRSLSPLTVRFASQVA